MNSPDDSHLNRLARETSPYLLQHARNPVDWYPWGAEAFAKAREEDKPIFLSVGYATCHWCHVMERESFEDEAIASQLGEAFVAVKVDREERPDVDQVYMRALHALGGHGGWPMSMFLTPTLAPFFGGTYFPPSPRHGLPSFSQLLAAVRRAWHEQRDAIDAQSQTLLDHLRTGAPQAPRTLAEGVHARALAQFATRFDEANGGFGGAPKFPQTPLLQYLLALAQQGEASARTMLLTTLHAMARGGIHDQVGGGFARYSTDARWHVPHFEKMLYDNAQLLRVYAGAWRLSGDRRLREVAEDTLHYLLREMHPQACPDAFASAQDADAEGVEGRFHAWTMNQLREALGDDATAAASLYGATRGGNWEHGLNVLRRDDANALQKSMGLDDEAFARWERSVRERLYQARARRTWPLTDDKVLADWNGLALRALAETARLLGTPGTLDAACRLARFLLGTMQREGQVHHAWRNGALRDEGFLSDHAQLGLGLVELHRATGDFEWLLHARDICLRMVEDFHEPGAGFFDSPKGAGTNSAPPARACEIQDGAVPSGTAAACELLLRLSGIFDREDWAALADDTLQRLGALIDDAPMAVPALLFAHLLQERGADLAVPSGPGADALWQEARQAFAPCMTVVHGPRDAAPLLAGRSAGQAYLCRKGRCELPATSSTALREQLSRV